MAKATGKIYEFMLSKEMVDEAYQALRSQKWLTIEGFTVLGTWVNRSVTFASEWYRVMNGSEEERKAWLKKELAEKYTGPRRNVWKENV